MAEVLDYIAHQIENLKESVEENNLLKTSGIYELTMYISRNPKLIYGGYKGSINEKLDKAKAEYGISVEFLREARNESLKLSKDKLKKFIEIVGTDKPDRDVKEVLTKLFRYGDSKRDDLIIAFVNSINYIVLNRYYEIANLSSSFDFRNSNLTYRSLPYGQIVPIPSTGTLNYHTSIEDMELESLINSLSPVYDITDKEAIKFYQTVYNKEEGYLRFDYLKTGAIGYIKNQNTKFLLSEGYSCVPLSIKENSLITNNENPGCSPDKLSSIGERAKLVEALSNNSDFKKIEGITGSKLYESVNNFAKLSAKFKDNTNGEKSINIKLYFDKKEDVFATIRSNDLKLSVSCADYGNQYDGLIDLYFNSKTEDLYFVNKNKQQFGYCKGLIRTQMSNCEHSIYAELLQPALSQQEKTALFQDESVIPVVLDEGIVRETIGLEDAIIRQGYLLSIDDNKTFFNLFIRNIASYVYSYAKQVEKSDEEGNINLIWETLPNPSWSNKEDDNYIPIYSENGKLKWNQYSDPNIFYIYDVRETFWTINQNMSIKEVLAYFVSKGGSSRNNSKYYRKLCQRILGVDYYVFSEKLLPFLLDEGLLCVEELEFDKTTNALLKFKYQYKYQYIKDDVYKKIDKLKNELDYNIKLLYGDVKGSQIIDYQLSILEKAKPTLVKFGSQNKNTKLTISIHNPIFFNDFRKDAYVSRFADVANIFNSGKISISTKQRDDEKYKTLEIDTNLTTSFQNYEEQRDLSLKNNHLGKFIEWLKFSKVKLSKEYLTKDRIIDGYVLPLMAKEFIPKEIMPDFQFQSTEGKKVKLALKFRKGMYKYRTFSKSNIWNPTSQTSRLTKESIENLIKAGLVSKKDKIDGYKEVVKIKSTGEEKDVIIKINPLNLEEANVIYDTLMAKYNKLESEIRVEGDRLFTLFCQTQLVGIYKNEIEEIWNSTYNNMALAELSKFPVFCEHSRWFGSYKNEEKPFQFNLREAQVEGLKFSISNSNSGLLAHEVGFGKTTTSIALISHMNLTGGALRNLVFTPKQVYEKFYDEITGNEQTGVLGLIGNYQNPYNVIKMGNARKDVLMGKLKTLYKGSDLYAQVGNESLKTYTTEEIQFIQDFKNVVDEARNQMSNPKIVPFGQPRFFTEPELINETKSNTRIPARIINSDADDWWGDFYGELNSRYGDIIELPSIEELLDLVDREIQKNKNIIEKEIQSYQKKLRYTKKNFIANDKGKPSSDFNKLPKYVQSWWASQIKNLPKIKGTNKPDYGVIRADSYPNKFWVTEIDGAIELGLTTKKEQEELEKKGEIYDGSLSPQGLRKIIELDDTISQNFFNKKDGKKLGRMTTLLGAIREQLIDELGVYKDYVGRDNSIVLCYHQAIERFRASSLSRDQAIKFVANIDDVMYSPTNISSKYEQLGIKPLSLATLDITGIVVDEIHNFNNLVNRPRPTTLSLIPDRPREDKKHFTLLPTEKSSAIVKKLPDGSTIGHKGIDGRDSPYQIKFNTSGKGSYKTSPTNLFALILEVQNTAKYQYGVTEKNSIMMSATPFTDNVFQMFTVFGMTNLERLKEANMDKVFDFFITYVKEEWRYNLTHRNEFGLFAEIEGYYNPSAMSNFIKTFANFKVSDAVIEASRPQKYLIPQSPPENSNKDGKLQAGTNTSSVNWSKDLVGVESYVELTDVQKSIIKTIGEFVEGKINNPYAICPNYLDVKVKDTGEVVFEDDEVQIVIDDIKKLLKQASSFKKKAKTSESEEKLEDAYDLALDLLQENSKNEIIKKLFLRIDDMLNPSEEEKEVSSYEINIDDLGLIALDEEQLFTARAIVGQSFGQSCVISPYLLKCDVDGEIENSLLKDYPLKKYKIRRIITDNKGKKVSSTQIDEKKRSLTITNFVEQSPKIKYAVDCAINSIRYDSKNKENKEEIGGQIIYLDRGKNFKYAGNTFNAYELIKQYIIEQNVEFAPNQFITEDEIGIITGGMGSKGLREELRDRFNGVSDKPVIKILLGSSAIKEGIDLNKRAHTLYILDSDFSPSNAMQLEGRIWRQGNMWENVRIVYVLGRDSIDAFVYSKLQKKINEIKKMLEGGVYEMNRTQFTINAKERIRRIISDVGQLTELEWQDYNDSQLSELSDFTSDISSIKEIKQEYGKVKSEYKEYISLINELYVVVINSEKTILAKDIKEQTDMLRENQYRVKGAKEGSRWRKENPFKPMTISEALKVLDKEIENNDIVFDLKDIVLNQDTTIIDANIVISQVIRLIMQNKSILQKISVDDYLKENTFKSIKSKKEDEKVITDRLIEVLFRKNEWKTYDQIIQEVGKFEQGSPKERIMSNFIALVQSKRKKDINNIDVMINGKPVFCDFTDIPYIISQLESKISKVKSNLSDIGKSSYFEKTSKEIENHLSEMKKIVGKTNEELVEKFDISMKLLKLRKR